LHGVACPVGGLRHGSKRKHRLNAHHLHLSSVRAGVLGLQRVGDAGVNAVLLGQAQGDLAVISQSGAIVAGMIAIANNSIFCPLRTPGIGGRQWTPMWNDFSMNAGPIRGSVTSPRRSKAMRRYLRNFI
jgi:hypothetical protein